MYFLVDFCSVLLNLFEEVVVWKGQLPRNCCEGDDFGFLEQPEMSFINALWKAVCTSVHPNQNRWG